MGLRIIVFTVGLFVMLAQTGCGSDSTDDAPSGGDQSAASDTQRTSLQPATTSADRDARQSAKTIVRFSANATSVDVTIGEDNPAVRDFLSMLPLTITVEEFAGREKISYLPRKLRHRGSPGSDPESGDLIYFVPWGNLGFYYNAEGIGYSDDTIHLGTMTRRSMNSSDSKAKSPSRSSTDGPLLRSFWSVPERHVEGVAAVSTSSKSSFSGQERELVSALFVLFGIGAIPGNETVDES